MLRASEIKQVGLLLRDIYIHFMNITQLLNKAATTKGYYEFTQLLNRATIKVLIYPYYVYFSTVAERGSIQKVQ